MDIYDDLCSLRIKPPASQVPDLDALILKDSSDVSIKKFSSLFYNVVLYHS